MDYETVDIMALLDDLSIPYSTKGENVSRGWVNLQCPFCGDPKNHCGINLKTGVYHCWVCGEKGGLERLLHTMQQLPYGEIKKIIKQHSGASLFAADEEETVRKPFTLPLEGSTFFPEQHLKYLEGRGFDPAFLISKYKLQAVFNIGKYRWRIIVPILQAGRAVSFVAMDILRNDPDRPKYLNCPSDESIVPVDHCLYNIDSVKHKAIIVEGVTDVWRLGSGAIATFRKGMTPEQISRLRERNINEVFVMYDGDAVRDSRALANRLCCAVQHVEVIEITGDPADMTREEVDDLRADLKLEGIE